MGDTEAPLSKSVIYLYVGADVGHGVESEWPEKLVVKVGMQPGSVLSLFLFAFMIDVVT